MKKLIHLMIGTLAACAPQVESDMTRAALGRDATVAVFGVYRSGRMDPAYWTKLDGAVSGSFGRAHCPLFVDERLAEADAETYSKIDSEARQEGIGAELLARFANKTSADAFVVLQVWGKIPPPRDPQSTSNKQQQPQGLNFGSGAGSGRRRQAPPMPAQTGNGDSDEPRALEIEATFFSRTKAERLGRVRMRYTGSTGEEALAQFGQALRQTLPDVRCVEWAGR